MLNRWCDACGKQFFLAGLALRDVEGFRVCSRCLTVQKQTGISMAELVAKNVAVVAEAAAWRTFRTHIFDGLTILVICLGCYVWFWKPEWIRLSAQVPVTLRVRDVTIGEGNVLEIRNDAPEALTNVTVMVTNQRGFPRFGGKIAAIAVDETSVLSAKDSKIGIVEKGDKITVECDPFFPITFTAEELGVK